MVKIKEYLRGEVYIADLDPVIGSEQGARRPEVIIQNDIGNKYSPTIIVAAVTSQVTAKIYPTEVRIKAGEAGLEKDSSVLLNQIKTIDKQRLENYIGKLDHDVMKKVDQAIKISLGLVPVV